MINLSRSKLLFVITIILALVVIISLILFSGGVSQSPLQPSVSPSPSPSSVLMFTAGSGDKEDPKLLIFDQLVVGETKDEAISAISSMKKKEEGSDETKYFFPSPLVDRDNLAITQQGILVFKRFIVMKDVDNWETPSVIDYKDRYGTVEYEKEGSIYYGPFETLFVWASQGVALIGNSFTDEVKEIHVFVPMSVEQYLQNWGADSTEYTRETPDDHSEEIAL